MDTLARYYLEMAPHGQVLVLEGAQATGNLKGDAISDVLMKFAGRPAPFVAVLIDLGGIDYRFSSGDLGSIAGTIAAWQRGWVAPCAIVMRGAGSEELKRILDLTKLSQLEQLRVVETKEAGLEHIREQLARAGA